MWRGSEQGAERDSERGSERSVFRTIYVVAVCGLVDVDSDCDFGMIVIAMGVAILGCIDFEYKICYDGVKFALEVFL